MELYERPMRSHLRLLLYITFYRAFLPILDCHYPCGGPQSTWKPGQGNFTSQPILTNLRHFPTSLLLRHRSALNRSGSTRRKHALRALVSLCDRALSKPLLDLVVMLDDTAAWAKERGTAIPKVRTVDAKAVANFLALDMCVSAGKVIGSVEAVKGERLGIWIGERRAWEGA